MSPTYPPILRGTREYDEVTRILGNHWRRWTADESAVQISQRWLKVDQFVPEPDRPDRPAITPDGDVVTRRRRIRIPKSSFMARPGRVA